MGDASPGRQPHEVDASATASRGPSSAVKAEQAARANGRSNAPHVLGELDDRFGDDRPAPKRKPSPLSNGDAKRRPIEDIDSRFGDDEPRARPRDGARGGGSGGPARDSRVDDRDTRDRDRGSSELRDRDRARGDGWKPKGRGPRYVGSHEDVRQHHSSIDERFDDERFNDSSRDRPPRTPAMSDGTVTPAGGATPRRQSATTPSRMAAAARPAGAGGGAADSTAPGGDGKGGGSGVGSAEGSQAQLETVRAELAATTERLATAEKELAAARAALSQQGSSRAASAATELASGGSSTAPGSANGRGQRATTTGTAPESGVPDTDLRAQLKERDEMLTALREAHKASLADKAKRMQELRAEVVEKEGRLTALRESHKLSLSEWNKNKLALISELSEKSTLLTSLKEAFKEQQRELQALKAARGGKAAEHAPAAVGAAAPDAADSGAAN